MNNLFNKWKDKATEYVDVRLNLLKLGFIERTSSVLGHIILAFIYIILSFAVLSFIGTGTMEAYIALTGSRIAGAFATAGSFLVLLGIIYGMRKRIIRSFAGIFIGILTEPRDDDDEEPHEKEIKVQD